MRASGQSSELRHSYQVAARTGPWVIAADGLGGAFTFTASVFDEDEIWLAQSPLDLVLAMGQTEWIWRGVAARIAEGRMTITLTRRPDVAGPRAT